MLDIYYNVCLLILTAAAKANVNQSYFPSHPITGILDTTRRNNLIPVVFGDVLGVIQLKIVLKNKTK